MLFSPVYTEAHPRRSTVFVSRVGLQDATFASRMNLRDPARGDSSRPLKSFNPFTCNNFRTLVHNGRLQPPFLQSLADSFHCNGGVHPLSNGAPSNSKSLANWRFDPVGSSGFHSSRSTGHGPRPQPPALCPSVGLQYPTVPGRPQLGYPKPLPSYSIAGRASTWEG
jgi:hypothetical protein